MPKKKDVEADYEEVDQDEDGGGRGTSLGRMSFGFSKKPTREAAADHDATKKSKEKVAPPPVR